MLTNKKIKPYDNIFDNNTENYIKNIIIYTKKDSWREFQNYEGIGQEEHSIWEELFKSTFPLAYKYGSKMYKEGINNLLSELPDFSLKIPNLNKVSKILAHKTNWAITPVAGFVDEIIFFELISQQSFPSSNIVRLSDKFRKKYKGYKIRNNLSYTPEPDIFHEIFGHAPFLLNKEYSKLFKDIGKLGVEIISDSELPAELISHNLKRLQNFVWWTLEFGLIHNFKDSNFQILGSGIVSSYDEIINVMNSFEFTTNCLDFSREPTAKLLKYDIESVALTRFDYSNLQDRYYCIDSFNQLCDSFYSNKDLFFYNGNI